MGGKGKCVNGLSVTRKEVDHPKYKPLGLISAFDGIWSARLVRLPRKLKKKLKNFGIKLNRKDAKRRF